MYTAKNSLNEKFSSLDYFRGFAGYGVAICHYYYYIYNLKHFEYLSFFFVEFFFILSGYVLTPQIIKVYNQNQYEAIVNDPASAQSASEPYLNEL